MITGNMRYKMPFDLFRIGTLIPLMANNLVREIPPTQECATDKPIQARVNWGNWIWDCECGGAEYAWDEGLGMCRNCFNSTVKHKYRPIVFPKGRAAIEKLLIVRPLMYRNWFPGESLEGLRAENRAHEDELLEGGR